MELINPNNNKFKHIVVTKEVYEQLRDQGKIGDSFNDVVKRLLGKDSTIISKNLSNIGENQ
jgi:predicted CopG family antitoxin